MMLDGIIKGLGIDPQKLQSDFATFVEVAKDVQSRLIRLEEKFDRLHSQTDNSGDTETLQGN